MSSVHLRVRVGSEHYAFGIEDVLEVAELGEVTPVPGAPHGVLGARNLRGLVLPVVDLAQVLEAPGEAPAAGLVVTEHDGRHAGLTVTELGNVAALPALSESSESRFLQGATWVDGSLVGVIDLGAVLESVSPRDGTR